MLGKSGDGDIGGRAHRFGGQSSRRRWRSDDTLSMMSFSCHRDCLVTARGSAGVAGGQNVRASSDAASRHLFDYVD